MAEEARANAERDAQKRMLEAQQESQRIVADANTRAEQAAANVRSQAETEARQLLDQARAEAELERNRALADLRSQVIALSLAAARQVVGVSMDETRQRQLVNDFFARDANGDPTPVAEGMPVALGPCIVTADEVDPQMMVVTVEVDGEQWAKGNLNGVATSLFRVISQSSKIEGLASGDTFASSPFGGFHGEPGRHLWPGATVELHAETIGTLRNRLGPRPAHRS